MLPSPPVDLQLDNGGRGLSVLRLRDPRGFTGCHRFDPEIRKRPPTAYFHAA